MGGFVSKPKPEPRKVEEQPKVASQMDAIKPDISPAGPTDIEVDQTLQNKRKGRRSTILTSPQGLNENYSLGKKTLLG